VKLILITVVGLIVGMMVACGGGGLQFANAQEAVESFNEFDVSNCDGQFYAMVGANSGIACSFSQPGMTSSVNSEVFTYDGDAENGCKDSGWLCRAIVDESDSKGNTIIFSGNVMLVVYAGADIANALLEDLQQ
jgi:hypothetical protein